MWATPVVQTLGMGRAFAQSASPVPCSPGISFIALNVTCGETKYFIKWEEGSGWEDSPGATPGCVFTPNPNKANGGDLGFTVSGPDEFGQVTITPPGNCTIDHAVVKGGQICQTQTGPTFTCPKAEIVLNN
jgi:hypothetical protein